MQLEWRAGDAQGRQALLSMSGLGPYFILHTNVC